MIPFNGNPAMAQFEKLTAPSQGTPIRFENGQPVVGNNPIIPFIRGDGTGVDIWPATQKVLDAAVAIAYGGSKTIEWFKVYAGDEACDLTAPISICRKTPSKRFAPTASPSKAPSPRLLAAVSVR